MHRVNTIVLSILGPFRRALFLLACLSILGLRTAIAGGVETVSVESARDATHAGSMFLIDIRTPPEWRESGVPDVAIPLDMTSKSFLQDLQALRMTDPDRKIGLICATGVRSRYLSRLLARKGVGGLVDVTAGVHGRQGWRARKLPLRLPDAPVVTSAEPLTGPSGAR